MLMEVLIFKTNITTKKKADKVASLLKVMPAVKHCNFDLEDYDKILRIEGVELQPDVVKSLLETAGFNCQQLY